MEYTFWSETNLNSSYSIKKKKKTSSKIIQNVKVGKQKSNILQI